MNRYTVTPEGFSTIVRDIEAYINKYITFSDTCYSLPLALWTIGTYCFDDFTAFPYAVITSDTKRSGKTLLSELMAFACSNPRNMAALTGPTMFRLIETEQPTIFFDESEQLSSEAASTIRSVLNVGYRKGQTIARSSGEGVKEYKTYCPKVFILIGDTYDTLADRSIVVRMKRATDKTKARFVRDIAIAEGAELRERIDEAVKAMQAEISVRYNDPTNRLNFLTDRDEEIWLCLFVLASIFCPDRIEELTRNSVDIATDKTAEARDYRKLLGKGAEKQAQQNEYVVRLLVDMHGILSTAPHHGMFTVDLLEALKALPTGPWRKFRGEGLTVHNMADMLSPTGVKPVLLRLGKGRVNSKVSRGYKLVDVDKALSSNQ